MSDLVFVTTTGTPVDPNNFSRRFVTWCTAAGVPRVRQHDLLHTCVSLLLSLGVNPRVVMEIVETRGTGDDDERVRTRCCRRPAPPL